MEYRNLGKTGVKVSPVCLGTMTLGREADEAESFAMMDYFVEQGFNFLDTADGYSAGGSEEVVGRWMQERQNRRDLVVATKVFATMGPGPNDKGLSRLHIQMAVEDSLRRLQTDVIDIYQIHRWDFDTPPQETLEALNDLVRQGKVRYIACSNLSGWQLAQYLYLADAHLYSRFVSLQQVYNVLNRSAELEVLPLCADQGLGVIPYNPLGGGVLIGKYRRGEELPSGSRLAGYDTYRDRYLHDEMFDLVDQFVDAAREMGVTPAQLVLAWVLGDDRITAPIVGARSLEQLQDSLQGAAIELTAEQRAAVPAVGPGKWVGKDPVYDR
ncbi:MAG: aldo/keto reductase [Candidatus Latescibacteria bacterium]|nr:aldo/keto reductase [Candidatus Latescibacterota bacterium]